MTSKFAPNVTHRLKRNKKKTVAAMCLLCVMSIMWVRVLTDNKPNAAKASGAVDEKSRSEKEPDIRIKYVELPRVKGRNDSLARDFFAGKAESPDPQAHLANQGNSNPFVKKLMNNLTLGAIELGTTPQAFINDKLLKVGDVLAVDVGDRQLNCLIKNIEANQVEVKFEDSNITLRLAESE